MTGNSENVLGRMDAPKREVGVENQKNDEVETMEASFDVGSGSGVQMTCACRGD